MVNVTQSVEDQMVILHVRGEVDASSSIVVDEALHNELQAGTPKILVDCSGLSYISSAGLGVFMSYIQEFEEKQIKFALYGLDDKVKSVFQILGLDQLLPLHNSKEEAKQYVG